MGGGLSSCGPDRRVGAQALAHDRGHRPPRHQPGWELQRSVALAGQVKYPGRYSLLTKTDRLRDLIERAGGLTDQAYAGGVQFYRSYTAGRPTGGDPLTPVLAEPRARNAGSLDTVARSAPERIGIDLPKVLADAKAADNIIMMGGDSIYIPEFDPVVMPVVGLNEPCAERREMGTRRIAAANERCSAFIF